MHLAYMQIAGFENIPVTIYEEEQGVCSELELNYSFNEFFQDTGGDGTLDDFELIKESVNNMRDEFGSLYDRANLELERIL